MNRLQPLAAEAVETLAALMKPSAPPSVRLGAARTVAEFGIHRDDAESILRKLGDIEALQRRPGTERTVVRGSLSGVRARVDRLELQLRPPTPVGCCQLPPYSRPLVFTHRGPGVFA